jgi:hypothetical protein
MKNTAPINSAEEISQLNDHVVAKAGNTLFVIPFGSPKLIGSIEIAIAQEAIPKPTHQLRAVRTLSIRSNFLTRRSLIFIY